MCGEEAGKKIRVEENQSHWTEVTLICQSKLTSHHHFWLTVPSLFAVPEAGIPRLNSTCSLHSDRKFFRLHESGYLIIQSPCWDQADLEQCLVWGSSESFQHCKVHNVCQVSASEWRKILPKNICHTVTCLGLSPIPSDFPYQHSKVLTNIQKTFLHLP